MKKVIASIAMIMGLMPILASAQTETKGTIVTVSNETIEGTIKEDKRAPTGYEVDVKSLEVIHFAEKYPITKESTYTKINEINPKNINGHE